MRKSCSWLPRIADLWLFPIFKELEDQRQDLLFCPGRDTWLQYHVNFFPHLSLFSSQATLEQPMTSAYKQGSQICQKCREKQNWTDTAHPCAGEKQWMHYILIWTTALVLSHTTFSFGSRGKNGAADDTDGAGWAAAQRAASGVQHQENGRHQMGIHWGPSWANSFIASLVGQTEQIADSITLDRTAGKFKQVSNVKKGLKISRWSLIKANAKGYRAEKGNKCTKGRWGIAVQAADLQVTVGKQLNMNE